MLFFLDQLVLLWWTLLLSSSSTPLAGLCRALHEAWGFPFSCFGRSVMWRRGVWAFPASKRVSAQFLILDELLLKSQLLGIVATLEVLFNGLGVQPAIVCLNYTVKLFRCVLLNHHHHHHHNIYIYLSYNLWFESAMLEFLSSHLLVQVLNF